MKGFHSGRPTLDDKRRSWSVCPHLSQAEDLFDYYLDTGSIMVLLGKVLCHECYEIIVSRNDLSEYINVSTHMTDHRFQNDFIGPLIEVNREYLFNIGLSQNERFWICCPHVARREQLEKLYSNCYPVFIQEGQVTCSDCLNLLPSTSEYIRVLLECDRMTDSQLQERVIDRLYRINREVLDAVERFSG